MRALSVILCMVLISLCVMASTIRLDILTQPSGGNVIVNNVWRGLAPVAVMVNPGRHEIQVHHHGYQEMSQTIDVQLPRVVEFPLSPLPDVVNQFPMALFLVNYQESENRRILDLEQSQEVLALLSQRLHALGFTLYDKQPRDEWDLVMDADTLLYNLYEEFPDSRFLVLAESKWSAGIFQQQKVDRLNMQVRVYDAQEGIILANFNESAESVGLMSEQIVLMQVVERVIQRFMSVAGGYMVNLSLQDQPLPVMIQQGHDDPVHWLIKSPFPVNQVRLVDDVSEAEDYRVTSAHELPKTFLFLLEASANTREWLEASLNLVESMISNLPEHSQWAVITFGDQIELIQGVTTRFDLWLSGRERIRTSGMSRLYDSLYNASSYLSRVDGLRVAVVLTDGIDRDYYGTGLGSRRSLSEAIEFLKENHCMVYPFGITSNNYTALLQNLAREFGTAYVNAHRKDPETLAKEWVDELLTSTFMIQGDTEDVARIMLDTTVFDVASEGHPLQPNRSIVSLIPRERPIPEPDTTIPDPVEEEVEPPTPEEPDPVTDDETPTVVDPEPKERDLFLPAALSGLELPETLYEVFSSAEIDLFDMDRLGNMVWVSDRKVYVWMNEASEIYWFELDAPMQIVSIDAPYLFFQTAQSVRAYRLLPDGNLEWILQHPVEGRVQAIHHDQGILLMTMTDGSVEWFQLEQDGRRWNLPPHESSLTHAALLTNRGILTAYADGLYNWRMTYDERESLSAKLERSVVSAFPYHVDRQRFMLIDTSGEVYYQPKDGSSPTRRRLNRGIVLDAAFAEESGTLITVHWDRTIRAFRAFDLREIYQIMYPLGFRRILVDNEGQKLMFQTQDGYLILVSDEPLDIPALSDSPSMILPNLFDVSEHIESFSVLVPQPDPVEPDPVVPPATPVVDEPPELLEEDDPISEEDDSLTEEEDPIIEEDDPLLEPDTDITEAVTEPATPVESPVTPSEEATVASRTQTVFRRLYSPISVAIPYRDQGYILARPGLLEYTNNLLERLSSFPIRQRPVIDMAISGEDFLAILYDDALEVIAFRTSIEVERLQVYSRIVVEPAQKVAFSLDSRRIILLQDREIRWFDINLQQVAGYTYDRKVTTWAVPYDRFRSLVFGDESGHIGYMDEGGISGVQRVAQTPILSVSWYQNDIYWITTSRLGRGTRASITIDGVEPKSLYSGDFGRNWIVIGTEKGELLIYNSALEMAGKATASRYPIDFMRGWGGAMITIDDMGEIKSWNLVSGIAVGIRSSLKDALAIFWMSPHIQVTYSDAQRVHLNPDTLRASSAQIRNITSSIQNIVYHPPFFKINEDWYAFDDAGLSERPLNTWPGSGLSVFSPWVVTWKEDMLQVFNTQTNRVDGTFKIGEGNIVSYAGLADRTLLFFFGNSMGIVNAFEPGQVLVVNVSDQQLGAVLHVMSYQDSFVIVGEDGIGYFSKDKEVFENVVKHPFPITAARYNRSRMALYGWKEEDLFQFSMAERHYTTYAFDPILGLDWNERQLFLMTKAGEIWVHDLDR